ncbi:MAG: hypothetical protein AAGF24_08020, partial [Cyanobacteria bacterium P01_H01_bin.121]
MSYKQAYNQAYQQYIHGNYAEAATLLEPLMDEQAALQDPNVRLLRGHVYSGLQQYGTALDEYETIARLTDDSTFLEYANQGISTCREMSNGGAAVATEEPIAGAWQDVSGPSSDVLQDQSYASDHEGPTFDSQDLEDAPSGGFSDAAFGDLPLDQNDLAIDNPFAETDSSSFADPEPNPFAMGAADDYPSVNLGDNPFGASPAEGGAGEAQDWLMGGDDLAWGSNDAGADQRVPGVDTPFSVDEAEVASVAAEAANQYPVWDEHIEQPAASDDYAGLNADDDVETYAMPRTESFNASVSDSVGFDNGLEDDADWSFAADADLGSQAAEADEDVGWDLGDEQTFLIPQSTGSLGSVQNSGPLSGSLSGNLSSQGFTDAGTGAGQLDGQGLAQSNGDRDSEDASSAFLDDFDDLGDVALSDFEITEDSSDFTSPSMTASFDISSTEGSPGTSELVDFSEAGVPTSQDKDIWSSDTLPSFAQPEMGDVELAVGVEQGSFAFLENAQFPLKRTLVALAAGIGAGLAVGF